MTKPAVTLSHVSKTFHLPLERASGIKQAFINRIKGIKGYKKQHVLKDISFTVEKGDFFGIVGRNGSGKSTLLKLISEIYTPDHGEIKINGTLVPFIELGVGFNPELTGRENVYLNGAMLGFSNTEVDAMYNEIVDFAELHDFMDQKLKNYSSGMQVRLAFSVAIKAQGDILVLDEVLAVGDEAFQRKCNEYFGSIKKDQTKTVILVTHSMESVRQFCNKAIMLENGQIVASGNPDKVASQYSKMFQNEYIMEKQNDASGGNIGNQISDVMIKSINIIQDERTTKVIKFREDFSIEFNIESGQKYEDLVMGVHVINQLGQDALSMSTRSLKQFGLKAGKNTIRFDVQNVFSEGGYYLNVAVGFREYTKFLIQDHGISNFSIIGMDKAKYSPSGLFYPDVKIEVIQ
ncbi:ABC transporter ATP-binding protein [Candidatus Saccharibacteria bacterium]|nr:ABC transporter ATP-binding protein [Candidatus Saccharibacteria bacterium]MCL1962906.1 ABC transporter ATP-binding protein [Candidatus Saccharibacteria bacterium]